MNTMYLILKWLHVLSSTVLLGTGAAIAFFFVRAVRTRDVKIIAAISREVVLADAVFTATAVVVQPLTGWALVRVAGYPLDLPWIALSLALYVAIGCCWLPVLWLQIRMRNMAQSALLAGTPLPARFGHDYRRWLALGWPAFILLLAIFYLMVAKPVMAGDAESGLHAPQMHGRIGPHGTP